ncbi:MAG: acyl-CoA dehydrogenase, partial [Rhodococcus sp. (in: high G+C Gram-positive bacteria)]
MTTGFDSNFELTDFQADVRSWLGSILPPRPAPSPQDRPDLAVFRNLSDEDEISLLDAARQYRR